jgi:heme/copper-type cytochrome/quinol oxidase subunit 2
MRQSVRALVTTASAVLVIAAAIVWASYPHTDGTGGAGDVAANGVREMTVTVYGWGMTPSVIRVVPGQRVRFVVTTDDVMHGFAINELGVNLALAPGRASRSADVHVNLAEGTYAIHCSVFCGLGHGSMKARLIVGSPPPDPKRMAPWIASGASVMLVGVIVGGRRRRGRH